MLNKVCNCCGASKSLDEFYNLSASRDGKSGVCKKCTSEKAKKYRKENAEKVKNLKKEEYARNRDSILMGKADYYQRNKHDIIKKARKYREENREKVRAQDRARSRAYCPKKYQEYKAKKSGLLASIKANRRAAKKSATPNWVDKRAIAGIYDMCPPGYHVDHIVPLTNDIVCGLHVPCNLQYLKASENIRKKNKFIESIAIDGN